MGKIFFNRNLKNKLSVSTTGKVWGFVYKIIYKYIIIVILLSYFHKQILKVQSIPMLKHVIHIFKKYKLVIRLKEEMPL